MRTIVTGLLISLPLFLFAQFETRGYVQQLIGVEYNPLKNPPSLLDRNEDFISSQVLTPLAPTSFSRLYLSTKREWEKITLRLRPSVNWQWFPSYDRANYLRLSGQQSLSYEPNKDWTFTQRLAYRKVDRQGTQDQEDLFQLSRSYDRWDASIGASHDLDKRHTIEAELGWTLQNYRGDATVATGYSAYQLDLAWQQDFGRTAWLQETEVTLSWQRRNWWLEREISTDSSAFSVRDMSYYKLRVETEIAPFDDIEWTPYGHLQMREASSAALSWREWRIGQTWQGEHGDWEWTWRSYYGRRIYPENLIEQSEEIEEDLWEEWEEPLQYQLLSNSLEVSYQINEQHRLMIKLRDIRRLSNNEDESRTAQRAYTNSFAGVGWRWDFAQ
ncbi:MAG: hypothetical protein AAF544_04735 [Bacteroidota bacterium]